MQVSTVTLKFQVPTTDVSTLTAYISLMNKNTVSPRKYVEMCASNFATSFGPNCTYVIESIAQEEV